MEIENLYRELQQKDKWEFKRFVSELWPLSNKTKTLFLNTIRSTITIHRPLDITGGFGKEI